MKWQNQNEVTEEYDVLVSRVLLTMAGGILSAIVSLSLAVNYLPVFGLVTTALGIAAGAMLAYFFASMKRISDLNRKYVKSIKKVGDKE